MDNNEAAHPSHGLRCSRPGQHDQALLGLAIWAIGISFGHKPQLRLCSLPTEGSFRRADPAEVQVFGSDGPGRPGRHFYASALIVGGASVKQVQTVLGYASAVVRLRDYAHLWPGDDNRTRSIVDVIFGAPVGRPRLGLVRAGGAPSQTAEDGRCLWPVT